MLIFYLTLLPLQIKIIAQDKGLPPRTNTTKFLTINIIDINDNPPKFSNDSSVNFTIKETTMSNNMGHVNAIDIDSGSILNYSITGMFNLYI